MAVFTGWILILIGLALATGGVSKLVRPRMKLH